VSVLLANELSLQELNQLIEIEQLTLRFLENFVSRSKFHGGEMPIPTPADAHGSTIDSQHPNN